MRIRWLAAFGMGLATLAPAAAQVPACPSPRISAFEPTACQDRPTELPPLLPVPPADPARPSAPCPRGPQCDYDPGYQYIPDRAPPGPKGPPCPCRPLGRLWVVPTLELGWSRTADVPPLLRLGVPDGRGGFLAGPPVPGAEKATPGFRAGFGLAGGAWLDECQTTGIDGSFYFLGTGTGDASTFAPGVPMVLPTTTGPFPLSTPAAGVGSHEVIFDTRFLTADANYRRTLYCETDTRLDGLLGYRYADVRELLDVYGRRLGPTGEIVRFRDVATTANHFHGGQIGLAAEHRMGDWYVALTKKVAFGEVFTDTDLAGKFRLNGDVAPFGFYSRPAVAGVREHSHFGVMSVFNVSVGRQFGEHGRVFVGYTLQYLTGVTRPGEVIDPVPDAFGPGLRMTRDSGTTDFWVQSVNLGMEWRY